MSSQPSTRNVAVRASESIGASASVVQARPPPDLEPHVCESRRPRGGICAVSLSTRRLSVYCANRIGPKASIVVPLDLRSAARHSANQKVPQRSSLDSPWPLGETLPRTPWRGRSAGSWPRGRGFRPTGRGDLAALALAEVSPRWRHRTRRERDLVMSPRGRARSRNSIASRREVDRAPLARSRSSMKSRRRRLHPRSSPVPNKTVVAVLVQRPLDTDPEPDRTLTLAEGAPVSPPDAHGHAKFARSFAERRVSRWTLRSTLAWTHSSRPPAIRQSWSGFDQYSCPGQTRSFVKSHRLAKSADGAASARDDVSASPDAAARATGPATFVRRNSRRVMSSSMFIIPDRPPGGIPVDRLRSRGTTRPDTGESGARLRASPAARCFEVNFDSPRRRRSCQGSMIVIDEFKHGIPTP